MTGVPPKKSLGQNFLADENVASRIVRSASLTRDDAVVEIGPGQGALTRELAEKAGSVTAIELDERLAGHLKENLGGLPNLQVVSGDALAFPYESLPGKVKVVANLPYYISTPIITKLLGAHDKISSMILMLQKEVAQRITASPGGRDYGYMSVMVQFYAEAEMLFSVPKEAFRPVPKVDSAVVRLNLRKAPEDVSDAVFFERVVSASFSKRRKMLRNSLKNSSVIPPDRFDSLMERLLVSGIDPSRRAETFSLSEFVLMTEILFENRGL